MSSRYEADVTPTLEDELTWTMRSIVRGDGRTTSVMHAILTGEYPGRPIEEIAYLLGGSITPNQIEPTLGVLRDANWLRIEVGIKDDKQIELYSLALPPVNGD